MNKRGYLSLTLCLIIYQLAFNCCFALVNDDFADEYFADKDIKMPKTNLNHNYESLEKIPIHLKINEKIKTGKKTNISEGQTLNFTVKRDVKYNKDTIIKAGTLVTGRLETYSPRGMNGVPAILVIDNFEITGIDSNLLGGPYIKKGLSLTAMVLPIKWALTPIPFVGSTTNLILGGNATLSPNDNIDIYYYPQRNSMPEYNN